MHGRRRYGGVTAYTAHHAWSAAAAKLDVKAPPVRPPVEELLLGAEPQEERGGGAAPSGTNE